MRQVFCLGAFDFRTRLVFRKPAREPVAAHAADLEQRWGCPHVAPLSDLFRKDRVTAVEHEDEAMESDGLKV